MRCSCHECGVYMAQSEGLELGCVCPACGYYKGVEVIKVEE